MSKWNDELAALVAARGRALVGYAYTLCGNLPQAEDIVQDTLVKTFARPRAAFIPGAARGVVVLPLHDDDEAREAAPVGVEAYVRRAILTLFLDSQRRRSRWIARRHLLADDGVTRSPDAAGIARADVAAALDSLAPRERAAMVLRHYDDMTVSEIAQAMNVAEGTVKRYLSDASAALRGVLAEDLGTFDANDPGPATYAGAEITPVTPVAPATPQKEALR